jgi:hypothetical protein
VDWSRIGLETNFAAPEASLADLFRNFIQVLSGVLFRKGGSFPLGMALRHCIAREGFARLSNLGSARWTIDIH